MAEPAPSDYGLAIGASQAHHNAQMHSDEFVVESLVSFDKITVLIHELIAIEVRSSLWPQRCLL